MHALGLFLYVFLRILPCNALGFSENIVSNCHICHNCHTFGRWSHMMQARKQAQQSIAERMCTDSSKRFWQRKRARASGNSWRMSLGSARLQRALQMWRMWLIGSRCAFMFVLHHIMWPVPRSTCAAGPVSFFPKSNRCPHA